MRILVCSTPVGALGTGIGGGVELTLHGMVQGLTQLGHAVEVVAPAGSLPVAEVMHTVGGSVQVSSQLLGRDEPITMPADPVLGAMWELVRQHQHRVDLVVNLAYDWLPFYLTPFLTVPVAHLVSMGSLNTAMDAVIARVVHTHPGTVAVHSRAQADTFVGGAGVGGAGVGGAGVGGAGVGGAASLALPGALRVVGNGIAVERYSWRAVADTPRYLGCVGRIAPEKGLDAVAEVSARTGLPVKVWGLMQDPQYFEAVRARHPEATLDHQGFVTTDQLQAAIGGCLAVLMTPVWTEAFGNVAIEALACGVPVVAWRRGGPAEIITDGETGYLVPPDDLDALVDAVDRAELIDRATCRRRVENEFSTEAQAARLMAWFNEMVSRNSSL